MIVWGGDGSNGDDLNTGGKYDPSTDHWTATSITNAPAARYFSTSVWTGTEMIVWGGRYGTFGSLNTGGRYNPATDGWIGTSTTNAPTGRYDHAAVWSGSEMIVWGGIFYDGNFHYLNTGGRYNPISDSWTATSLTNAPSAREDQTAVWTGNQMIVWGGTFEDGTGYQYFNTGGKYDPGTDSWISTSITDAPAARVHHTAIWTGSEMIVWGGDHYPSYPGIYFNTGGKYDPDTDSWTATSTTDAPFERAYHTAVWTGNEMIIWGGGYYGGYSNTGGRYNPSTDSWTATSTINAPEPRAYDTAVWTGSQMVVWGGWSGYPDYRFLDTGGRYCAEASEDVIMQDAVSRKTHGSVGSFDVDLPISGTPGIECRLGGAAGDYTMVVTFEGNVAVTGNPPAQVTSGTGCVGSSATCSGNVSVNGNIVTIPLTNIANAQTINVRLNGMSNGAADAPTTSFTIPMSILVGDVNGNGSVNASDVAQTKSRAGQAVDITNFRSDVNVNGSINSTDTSIVKQKSGMSLPPD
jgi:N-acetylneuraminic acid mutarotase